uniref:TROVE domain-containing protein n=1 Tax=Panagrellus redivivus TaxID=6233 RepID=A0A7E4UWD5_PANRE
MADGDAPPSPPDSYNFSHIRFALNEAAHVDEKGEDSDEQLPKVTEATIIRRFLFFGTTGPIYHASGRELTCKTATALTDIIKDGKGSLILEEPLHDWNRFDFSPGFFAFALCARAKYFPRGDLSKGPAKKYNEYLEDLQKAALDNLNKVCKFPKQLFEFMSYAKHIMKEANPTASWDTVIAKAIANWYYQRNVLVFARMMTIRKVYGFTHRDLVRLAHVDAEKTGEKALLFDHLFHYAVYGKFDLKKNDEDYKPSNKRTRIKLLQRHAEFCELPIDDDHLNEAVDMILKYNFTEEQVPMVTKVLQMAALKLLDEDAENKDFINWVAGQIADENKLHPLSVVLIADQYNSGRNLKATQSWNPNPKISDAFNLTYEKCFYGAKPSTDLRYLLVFDVSNAMNKLTEAALETVYFGRESEITNTELDNTMNLDQVVEKMENLAPNSAKRVNGAAPMEWALAQKKEFDVFIGSIKNGQTARDVSKALKIYRKEMNLPKAKLITMDVLSKKLNIADGYDAGMLDIVGLNQDVPKVIKSFAMDKV